MAILLIRHGETLLNAQRIVQWPDTPLSARGQRQAERLARRLTSFPVAAILASDYARARMTAEALHRETSAALSTMAILRERNFGEARGRAYDKLGVELLAPDYHPRDGESWDSFHARVGRAWAEVTALAAASPGDTAVVTHGLVCRAVVERHADLESCIDLDAVSWGNTALTVLEAGKPWRVTRLACTAHLDGSQAEASA